MEKKREETYMKWFDEVKTTYLSMLNNRIVFEKKLEMLEVRFSDSDTTAGLFLAKTEKKVILNIFLEIAKNDSKLEVMHLVAHELTHLLFAETDKLGFNGYSANDDSVSVSHIKRKVLGTDQIYGMAFEEGLCEYIAFSVVKNIFKNVYTENEIISKIYKNKDEKDKKYFTAFLLMREIVKYFGNEIDSKIDELEFSEKFKSPKNYLLYTAATGTLSIFINDFEACTYKGAWQKLNKLFEEFWNDNSKIFIREQIIEILELSKNDK